MSKTRFKLLRMTQQIFRLCKGTLILQLSSVMKCKQPQMLPKQLTHLQSPYSQMSSARLSKQLKTKGRPSSWQRTTVQQRLQLRKGFRRPPYRWLLTPELRLPAKLPMRTTKMRNKSLNRLMLWSQLSLLRSRMRLTTRWLPNHLRVKQM